jgi:iduronate 2-sulfatase
MKRVLLTVIMALTFGQVCTAKRPNVLFIVCDDLNTHVSTSGYSNISTPALDRLAAEGTTFRRAYCQYPVCGPSRASFLSGLYPESTGVLDNKTDIRNTRPDTPSLPELFKQSGYWTGGVGKVFHGKLDHGERAWNRYHKFENERNPVIAPIQKAFEAEHGSIDKPKNKRAWRTKLREIRPKAAGQTPPGYGPTDMTDAEHKDGKNVRQIASWLDAKEHGDKPFFMTCGIHKPHVPFWAPQKYFDMYPKEKLTFALPPANDWEDIPALAMNKRFTAFGFKKLGQENDPLRRNYTQAYHACISFIDAQIGLLFDALKRNQQWDNTIVVLISDHGYHLGEHFMWGKVTLFEECARVPLIMRVPGRSQPGVISQGLVELVDLYPTLAALCDVPLSRDIQGQSFASLLDNPAGPGKAAAYTVVTRGKQLGRSIRTAGWRYAEWGSAEACELYDLTNDPQEYRNLATLPQHRSQLEKMRALLGGARVRAVLD